MASTPTPTPSAFAAAAAPHPGVLAAAAAPAGGLDVFAAAASAAAAAATGAASTPPPPLANSANLRNYPPPPGRLGAIVQGAKGAGPEGALLEVQRSLEELKSSGGCVGPEFVAGLRSFLGHVFNMSLTQEAYHRDGLRLRCAQRRRCGAHGGCGFVLSFPVATHKPPRLPRPGMLDGTSPPPVHEFGGGLRLSTVNFQHAHQLSPSDAASVKQRAPFPAVFKMALAVHTGAPGLEPREIQKLILEDTSGVFGAIRSNPTRQRRSALKRRVAHYRQIGLFGKDLFQEKLLALGVCCCVCCVVVLFLSCTLFCRRPHKSAGKCRQFFFAGRPPVRPR